MSSFASKLILGLGCVGSWSGTRPTSVLLVTLTAVFSLSVLTARGTIDGYEAIVTAARAPYEAFWRGEAATLCDDFVPHAAALLGGSSSLQEQCGGRVRRIIGMVSRTQRVPHAIPIRSLVVADVKRDARGASATLVYRGRGGILSEKIALEESGGRWLVASRPVLVVVGGCRLIDKLRVCGGGPRRVVFTIGIT